MVNDKALQHCITKAFAERATLHADNISPERQEAILSIIDALDRGYLRVAEKQDGQWQVHSWVKQAILLYFRLRKNTRIDAGLTQFYDKIPLKYQDFDELTWCEQGARVVPSAMVRKGAFVAPNVILMPSYVNIGAYIGQGSMIDTWAAIGSCAQIGDNVHISGGVGIGGVLEPLQSQPTIVEDHCCIGARSEIGEGVIVESGAVISMGVYLGQSTRIYDRQTGEISYGRIPSGAVVVPGNLTAADGSHSLYCAVIAKQVDARTREKVGLNALLRDIK